jgi:EmrB/QacA subfamily drug resistance transporter
MDAVNSAARPAPLSHPEVRTIIIGVMVAMFIAALDQTIVATALPTIGRELGNFTDLPWVVTAYLVAATAVAPLYGKFSDIHGRRVTMLIGISTFVVGSIACALAPNMLSLIAARALQGLGGGGLISLAQTVVADVTSPRERGRYQGYFAAVFASSSLLGPVLGGIFAEHFHWSIIFWINLPIGLLAYAMTNSALKRLPRHERWHRLDVLGAALLVAASLCLMLALSWGGERHAWTSPEVLGLFGASVLLWVLFGLRHATAAEPLVPPTVLSNSVVRAGTASSCFGMGALIGLTVFLPVYFEAVIELSSAQSGLALLPLTVGVVLGATVAGRRMVHVVHYKRIPLVGMIVAMAGCLALATFSTSLSLLTVEVLLALVSMGMGTMLPVTTVAVQNAVAPRELGTTTSAIGFFRQLGGAFMVAVFGAIVLSGRPSNAKIVPVAVAEGGVTPFAWMFAIAALAFLIAFLLLLMMEERPFRGRSASPEESSSA